MRGLRLTHRILLLTLAPAWLITLLLTMVVVVVGITEIDGALKVRGTVIVRQLAPASEYGAFSGNREVLQALTQAVTWAQATLSEDGHDSVRAEKVMVPHWVRGAESAELVAPVARPLHMLGLGGSVGTARKGLEAELLVVSSFDELTAAGPRVKGKIVLYDVIMPPYGAHGSGYGKVIGYRSRGADRASALGAVAVLVRSLTARSLRSPHTGMMRYDDKQPRIPAAAVSTEDAALLHRLADAGPVRVRLRMAARTLPDAE